MSNRLGFTVKKSATLINHLKPYGKHDATSVTPINRTQPDVAQPKQRAGGVRKAKKSGTQQNSSNSIKKYFQPEPLNALQPQEPSVVAEPSPEILESHQPPIDTFPAIRRRSLSSLSLFSELTSLYGEDPILLSDTLNDDNDKVDDDDNNNNNNNDLIRPLRQRSTETRDQLFGLLIRTYDMCSLENLVWMEVDNWCRQADPLRLTTHNKTIMDLDDLGTSRKRARAELEPVEAGADSRHNLELEPQPTISKRARTIKPIPIPLRAVGYGYLSSPSSSSPTLPLVLRVPPKDHSQTFLDIQALYSAVEEEFDDLRRQVRSKLSMKEVEVLLRGEFGGTRGVQVC